MRGSSAKGFLSCKSWAALHWGFCHVAVTDWIARIQQERITKVVLNFLVRPVVMLCMLLLSKCSVRQINQNVVVNQV